MANNLIQIKRSLTTATPTSLANGEFAYTSNGDVLYIGANGAVTPIGGKRFPGVLTANQALVANSTSYIDVIKTANLYIGTMTVNAINAVANVTHLGAAANNEIPTSWAVKTYVDSSISYTVTNNSSNTQILFNDSGVVAGNSSLTFNKTTGTITSSGAINIGSNVVINTSSFSIAGPSAVALSGAGLTIGSNTSTGTATLNIANTTGNATLTTTALTINDATTTRLVANTTGVYHTGTVNASVLSVGTSVVGNSTGVYTTGTVNGSIVSVGTNFIANSTQVTSTLPAVLNANVTLGDAAADIISINGRVGTAVVPSANITYDLGATGLRWNQIYGANLTVTQANTAQLGVSGNATISGSVLVTNNVNAASFSVGTNLVGNTSGVYHTGTVNAASHTVGTNFIANSIGVYSTGTMNAASHSVGTNFIANSIGVYSTGTVNGSIVSVGSNFIANSTQVTAAVPVVMNANVSLGDNVADRITVTGEIASNVIPSANITHNLGAINDRWNYLYAANVHSTQGYFEGSVQILGDLFVSGNVTTVNVSSLEVQDPMIYLAGNNYASDLVDIGFVGNYNDGVNNRHAGLIRHAADDEFYLFHRYLPEPDNNVIEVSNVATDFTVAKLHTYLYSGGLVTNATHVAVTANSTVAVNITANSITLSTPLAATSGGTGHNTYTSGDLLVANTGNALSKLALGATGYVLQSNGSALVYDTLDGGVF